MLLKAFHEFVSVGLDSGPSEDAPSYPTLLLSSM